VIKIKILRYFKVNGCYIYWCLVNLIKPFDALYRETLWLILIQKKGVIIWLSAQNIIHFGGHELTDFVGKIRSRARLCF
jgi:hypothetical protein